ncbi:hypothetical protein A5666_24405 [Mycolicibacterium fortuitum]|nr:hypothetical protein A5665_24525 [Mycolicibacterium fortuitum]OBI69905.1 hypothetical protein A5666_24405 [Mycolicibacterium fortuitum]
MIYLSGEGGEDEYKSRHQAICKRYGMNKADIEEFSFSSMHKVAPLDDTDFIDAIRHHLDAVQPVLVVIDPLYAYHPHGIDVSNVYSRGQMLAQIRSEIEPYAALIIGDHINKSARDDTLDLDDIGFSGVSQWVDSWSLQRVAKFQSTGPDSFAKLQVEFGSRRTGSMRYEIDWHLTRDMTDPDVIKWAACDWTVVDNKPAQIARSHIDSDEKAIRAIQLDVDNNPETNKTNTLGRLAEAHTGLSRRDWRDMWDRAIRESYLAVVTTTEVRPYGKSTREYQVQRFKRGREIGKGDQS